LTKVEGSRYGSTPKYHGFATLLHFIKHFFEQDGELAAEKAFGSVTVMKSMGGRGSEPVPFCVMNQANFEAVLRHVLLVRHLRVNIPKRCALMQSCGSGSALFLEGGSGSASESKAGSGLKSKFKSFVKAQN
jgi:hypothetical protein